MPLRNFVDAYTEYAVEFSDAPEVYHTFAGLGLLSMAVARKVRMPFGRGHRHPNLWMLLMGPSGDRKTTAMGAAQDLASRVRGIKILPNEFSREGLLENIGQAGGGTFLISEFASFMGGLRANYNEGAIGLLTELYDVPAVYRRHTMRGEIVLKYPCLNVIACSTPDFMAANEDEWKSGFGPRFMLIPGRRTKYQPLPPSPDERKEARLIRFLRNCVEMPSIEFSLAGKALYVSWAEQFDRKNQGRTAMRRSVGNRLEPSVLKVAMLMEIASREDFFERDIAWVDERGDPLPSPQKWTIKESSVQQAIDLVEWLDKCQGYALSQSSIGKTGVDRDIERLIAAVQDLGDEAFHSRLMRKCGLKKSAFMDAMQRLVASGEVVVTKAVPPGGKQKVNFYTYVGGVDGVTGPEGLAIAREFGESIRARRAEEAARKSAQERTAEARKQDEDIEDRSEPDERKPGGLPF